ncbi:ATP-dependent helicase [Pedobacter sp. SG908]|uniref:UvrD-helicase domain-containing protein n=1 Tax=Pedobacter sp. SG908 TaxID=2587135 RepID=UPI00141DB853|nr:ATP-dependent helicase [Pedobacter sp. SG908]NII83116.1 DNA helicase-2/ATP-dependent DNA helicase PcrA [Pedobacter sp. SG908]
MSVTIINSDSVLDDFETHFKVFAGPGAGKTKWLVEQINNVLTNSKRLDISRKIACITYTNVAVDTITKRLRDGIHQVEVTTIHGFLYKHVLKPYAHFLPSDYQLNVAELKGHDDKVLTGYVFLKEWKEVTKQVRIKDDKAVAAAFHALRWKFDDAGILFPGTKYPYQADGYSIKNASYMIYKKMAWSRGVVHHDDVLYLSFELIRLFPFILDVLRAKFPYFFIDEFQDISPIQLKLLNKILEKETIVGVVGDSAQSIYSFMGATADQLTAFFPTGCREFKIEDNWRSTQKIVDLLNLVRTDLVQKANREVVGEKPVIIVGDKISCLKKVIEITGSIDICTLSRDNLMVNAIRKGISTNVVRNVILEMSTGDSSSKRRRTVLWCARAVEYAEQGYFKDALKEIEKIDDIEDEQLAPRRSLEILKTLLNGKSQFIGGNVMDLFEFINTSSIAVLPKPTGLAIKNLYNTASYSDLAVCINAIDESLPYRTIHKSKGDEFDCTLLMLSEAEDGSFDETEELGFLLKPDLGNEENRIKYVAISRAQNRLYIRVPSLSAANTAMLTAKGFEVLVYP